MRTEEELHQEILRFSLPPTPENIQKLHEILTELESRFPIFMPTGPNQTAPPGKEHYQDWLRRMSLRKFN